MAAGTVKTNARWVPYYERSALGASIGYATMPSITIGDVGILSLQCLVDNDSGLGAAVGGNPTDAPIGYWELWFSSNDVLFTRLTNTAVDAVLAPIAPAGNTVINLWALFSGAPAQFARIGYHRTSGGGGDSRASLWVTTR